MPTEVERKMLLHAKCFEAANPIDVSFLGAQSVTPEARNPLNHSE